MKLKHYDFKKLREVLTEDARRQHDEVVSLNSLEMHGTDQPTITYGKNGGPGCVTLLTNKALHHLCGTISVPYNFLVKMSPDLRARTVNEFMEKNAMDARGDRKMIMLRMKKQQDERMYARAILPGDYSPVSHLHLLDITVDLINEFGLRVVAGQDGPVDDNWIIRLVDSTTASELGTTEESDKTFGGIELVGSEVGDTNLMMVPFSWQLVCSNGLHRWKRDRNVGVNLAYRGLREAQVRRIFMNAFENCFELGKEIVDKMAKSRNILQTKKEAFEAIRRILIASGLYFSRRNYALVCRRFDVQNPAGRSEEERYSVHQIVTQMTREARQYDWIRRRALEEEAAKYMDTELERAA